jgi:hypothetical protein
MDGADVLKTANTTSHSERWVTLKRIFVGVMLLGELLSLNAVAKDVSEEQMMSYLPKHLKVISPYSWDHPQRWIYMRKRRDYTEKKIDFICQASQVIT